MDTLQLQEKRLYEQLNPLFNRNGYEALPMKKQFRQTSKSGFRSVLFTLNGDKEEKTLDVQLGIRFNLVEELVHQFLGGRKEVGKDSITVITSLARLKHHKQKRLVINENEESLQNTIQHISTILQEKGFSFLNSFSNLHRADKMINRKPSRHCPIMFNQIHRCFKGIAMARLLHRTDFEKLVSIYRNYLYSQWAPLEVTDSYNRLVRYLKYFSFN